MFSIHCFNARSSSCGVLIPRFRTTYKKKKKTTWRGKKKKTFWKRLVSSKVSKVFENVYLTPIPNQIGMLLEAARLRTSVCVCVCDVYTAASESFHILGDDSLGATLTRHCWRIWRLVEFFFFSLLDFYIFNGHNSWIVKPVNIASQGRFIAPAGRCSQLVRFARWELFAWMCTWGDDWRKRLLDCKQCFQ